MVSQNKVKALVSPTSLGVEALVSPQRVATLPMSIKDGDFNIKPSGHASQSTSNKLKKQWIPKIELDLHPKAIETPRKGQNNISGKGPEFHSLWMKCTNEDEYSHSPAPERANDVKILILEETLADADNIQQEKRGKARTFKSETNFTRQEGVPASDFALLV